MMNVITEPREPIAAATDPKPGTKAPRRARKVATAKPSAPAQAPVTSSGKTPRGAAKAAPAAKRAVKSSAAKSPAVKSPAAKRAAKTAKPDAVAAPVVTVAEPVAPVAAVAKARTSRETVKLTEGDLAALGQLSARAGGLGRQARKSTLVRAAIRALAVLDDAGLAAALDAPMPAPPVAADRASRKAR